MTAGDIRQFYDGFLESRMLDYRLKGPNERLRKAIERLSHTVRPGETYLDLGCGIGIIAEAISSHVRDINVLACDLSPRNVWYAQKTIRSKNIHFLAVDIIHEFEDVVFAMGDRKADVISLIDVIEHISPSEHEPLLKNIARIAQPEARLVITYPSPLYQRYLQEHDPQELQMVDEIVEIKVLAQIVESVGFRLKLYSLEDVWMQNQYVHAVFQRDLKLQSRIPLQNGILPSLGKKLTSGFQRLFARPYRKWKYVDRVFKAPSTQV